MKNRCFQVFLSIALFIGVSSVNAQKGWVTSVKVQKVVVTYGGGINVRVTPDLSGCVSQSGYGERYASVYPDHPGIDKIQSVLLAAYMSDKPVAIYLMDDTCKVGEVELGGR
ncbi:MAG: hypothetical protein HWE27_10560 [Gammaproteobacteria bacterium]|nr:hypothetical protein [Gammaproteobacteria bacterium]